MGRKMALTGVRIIISSDDPFPSAAWPQSRAIPPYCPWFADRWPTWATPAGATVRWKVPAASPCAVEIRLEKTHGKSCVHDHPVTRGENQNRKLEKKKSEMAGKKDEIIPAPSFGCVMLECKDLMTSGSVIIVFRAEEKVLKQKKFTPFCNVFFILWKIEANQMNEKTHPIHQQIENRTIDKSINQSLNQPDI